MSNAYRTFLPELRSQEVFTWGCCMCLTSSRSETKIQRYLTPAIPYGTRESPLVVRPNVKLSTPFATAGYIHAAG